MNRILAIIFPFAILAIASCSNVAIYHENINIPKESWNLDSIAVFRVNITDTSSTHSIYLNIRNSTDYPNSNLYLFIQTTSPTGASLRDTVEYWLADKRGRWLGKGFGAIRDNKLPYKTYIRFPDKGEYVFKIQQGMRAQNLKGIASVGLRIERVDD